MAKVYVIQENGKTVPMQTIRCSNEDEELQRILEINPDLIPGEQINPDDPRRWLIIKREMPVPDPNTGDNRWSIDLFMIDQDAIPTFVECKRYNDTRSRREVVGQMLDYAANGPYYWTREEILTYAEDAAAKRGFTLEEEIRRLKQDETEPIESFFQRVQDNLREGQIRLVFFLEKAPQELKSIVDFLNRQMERSEVLLVEARQYEFEGLRVVNPILFGYTEEARQIKKTVSVTTGRRRRWDQESFFEDAKGKLSDEAVNAIRDVYEKSREAKAELSWGTGKVNGSFSIIWPGLGGKSLFTISSDGWLTVNFGNLDDEIDPTLPLFLKDEIVSEMKVELPDDYIKRYPNIQISHWQNGELLSIIEKIEKKYLRES